MRICAGRKLQDVGKRIKNGIIRILRYYKYHFPTNTLFLAVNDHQKLPIHSASLLYGKLTKKPEYSLSSYRANVYEGKYDRTNDLHN